MKQLVLFLFDQGDYIKASGSESCTRMLSVETSKNVASVIAKEKK